MKRIIAIIIGALALAGTGFSPKGIWIIDAESQLTIEASTNVNDFTCKFEYSNGTDTLRYIDHRSTRELRFTRGRITVPIRRFNCCQADFKRLLESIKVRDASKPRNHFCLPSRLSFQRGKQHKWGGRYNAGRMHNQVHHLLPGCSQAEWKRFPGRSPHS